MLTTTPASLESLDLRALATVVGGCHKKATATATAIAAPCACAPAAASATAVAAAPSAPEVSTNVSISGY